MKPGVLLVNKPTGFTSFDIIAVLRGVLHERRLGHTGTLDPLATGVLPVLVGVATKAADILPEDKKGYIADFRMGMATDTLDITGNVTKTLAKRISEKTLRAAMEGFKGTISQIPPMYSAVQINGKRLYDLARQGVEVERKPREVTIHALELISYSSGTGEGRLFVSCSKGTYVRSLIDDIGRAAGSCAVMTALERRASAGFMLEDCMTLDEIRACEDIESRLIPIDSLFVRYKRIDLSEAQARMYKNGIKLDPKRIRGARQEGLYRVYSDEFLGIAELKNGELKIFKNFWQA